MNLKINPDWLEWLKSQWQPKPINPPSVDPDISELDPLQRSAETIRFSILSIELWISPHGQVREWLRHNSRLAAWLAIPAFLVLPIITFALWQLMMWLGMLVGIAGKLIIFPVLALVAACVIWVVVQIVKAAFTSK